METAPNRKSTTRREKISNLTQMNLTKPHQMIQRIIPSAYSMALENVTHDLRQTKSISSSRRTNWKMQKYMRRKNQINTNILLIICLHLSSSSSSDTFASSSWSSWSWRLTLSISSCKFHLPMSLIRRMGLFYAASEVIFSN